MAVRVFVALTPRQQITSPPLSVSHEHLSGKLFDQPLHFQTEQGDGNGRALQATVANHFVDVDLLFRLERVVNAFLGLGQFDGGQHHGFLRRRRTIGRRKQIFELAQDVLGAFAELGPFLDQLVATLAAWRVDAARHRENLAAIFGGKVRRNHRAAGQVSLHHHGAQCHSGHDAVADGERLFVGGAIEWELGDDGALGSDAFEQLRVLRRKHDVDARAEDGDGASFGRERALMSGRVDAARASAHHGHADIGQLVGKFASHFQSVMRGLPRTDHGNSVFVLGAKLSFDIKHHLCSNIVNVIFGPMKSMVSATRKAISYVRFSTQKQEHGFSLARQLENTKGFCQRHRLFLDESLTVKDLGKSAFKGANADKGNLAVFLDAVRQRKIAKGTVLVVEALDRLTRNNIVEASHLLTDILRHGIDVGLVSEDKVYSYDYINKNPFEFIVATTYLIRGGDESRMKSDRVKDSWVRKKRAITQNKAVVKIPAPCWLKREGNKWVVIEEKAKIVREIFADYLKESQGIWMLSQSLNQRKVPVITQRAKPGSKWHRITMHRFLTDKAVIGTYSRMEPPVEKYFPAIVSQKEFYAVQAKLKDRRQFRGRHSLKDISLFKGLCKCSKCGATMTRITRTRKKKSGGSVLYRYLYCHNSILGLCLPAKAVDLTKFEMAFCRYTQSSE